MYGPAAKGSTESFAALLAGAKAGNQRSWVRIYEALAPRVRGYLRSRGSAEPDDAVGVSDAVLWQAVQALDPELRTIVELRYREDLSYQAIADRLQLPVGTVGTRLMRAHERLRILLGPPA